MIRREWIYGVAMLTVLTACGDDSESTGAGGQGGMTGSGGMGGSVEAGPNCAGLAATCGSSSETDCCLRGAVEGGTFFRGYDGVNNVDMTHPATVSSFELGSYEVTVGRFRAFVDAGMGTQLSAPGEGDGAHPLIADSGWFSGWDTFLPADSSALTAALSCDNSTATWSETADPTHESLPMSCVTWFEAFAFCIWDGGRLPTEAEWNYAAAGGDEQREYPWGSGLDDTHAAYGCLADGNPDCGFTDILAVGSLSPASDGRWGQADLGGNVWEFVLDWWAPYIDPCDDCANIMVTMYHTDRGGGWGSPPEGVTASQRNFVTAASRSPEIGFRCAYDP